MDSHVLESMKVDCYKLHLCFLFLKFKFSDQTKVGLLHKNVIVTTNFLQNYF